MKIEAIITCRYCNFYKSDDRHVLGRHEANCWKNPNASGKINSDWYCSICGIRFMKNKELRTHNKGLHDVKKVQHCRHCQKNWTTTDNLRILHEKRCPQNKNSINYKCKFCLRKALSELKNNEHEANCFFNPINLELDTIVFNPINENNVNNIGVYKIITPTGKVYIGMTNESFKNRWRGHLKLLNRGEHHCSGLQRTYNKYGWDALTKEIVEEYHYNDSSNNDYMKFYLLNREKEIWNIYNKNYIMLNGEPSGRGSVKHSDETKKKIAETNKRRFEENRKRGDYCRVYFLNCQNINCNNIFCSKKGDKKYCSNECRKVSFSRISKPKNFVQYSICHNKLCCNYTTLKYCSDYCKNNKFLKVSKEIEFLYNERNLTVREIADELGTTHTTVINRMKSFNITPRSQKESLRINRIKKNFSYDKLYRFYIKDKMSISEISKFYGSNYQLVEDALDFYGLMKS